MLELTTDATKHLLDASARRTDTSGRIPRFARQSGQIKLGFVSAPEPGDKVIVAAGVKVVVAKDLMDKLDRSVIDVRREQDGDEVLVLRRQNDGSHEGTKAGHV